METLFIQHESGYMELYVEKFFPCKINVARKIFPMICRYCSEEVKNELKADLQEQLERYNVLIEKFKQELDIAKSRNINARLSKTKTLQKRMIRNIEIFKSSEEKFRNL